MNKKRRVKAVIDGQEYTIIGDKSAAHIELVAETVNQQLADLKSLSSGSLSKEEQAILVAINAVSDQLDCHEKMIQIEKNRQNEKH